MIDNTSKKIPSINDLRAICQTPESSQHDSWYGKFIGRRFSIYFTKLFLYTPLNGNHITLLWCFIELIAASLFLTSNYFNSIVAAVLLHLAFILDGTDGEVSRFRKTSSLKGEYLDRLCHNVSYPAVMSAITISVVTEMPLSFFVFGFVFVVFFILVWLVDLEFYNIFSKINKKSIKFNINYKLNKSIFMLGKLIFFISNIDSIIILIFFASLFKILYIVVLLYSIILPARWLGGAILNIKKFDNLGE